jgi:cytochrome P450
MSEQLMNSMKTPPRATGGDLREQVRNPLGFFLGLTREYGDIVQYRAAPEPAYLLNHPDFVKHVLQDNARNYNKDTFLTKHQLQALTGQGLITSENPLWRKQRRLIQPAFHRQVLTTFATLINESLLRLIERWQKTADSPFDIAKEMTQITLEIVTQALFGYDIGAEATMIGEAMDVIIGIAKPKHPKFQANLKTMNRIVYGIIEKRRQQPNETENDLLDMLLNARYEDTNEGMDDQQLRDEVMSLLVAGHETTANTLNWLWVLLAQNPLVYDRLQAEVKGVLDGRFATLPDLPQLTYTQMVVQEAMRLYPAAWTISRRALGNDDIGGYHIPADAIIALSPYTTHRHVDFWEKPDEFYPEHFTPERVQTRTRYAYFPFGGGARQCIGDQFALMECHLIVPTIAQHFRLELVSEHPIVPHAVATIRPRHGIQMTVTL